MSRLAIKQSKFCCSISLAKSNESLTLSNVKFTSEKETKNKLFFLDIEIPRDKNQLSLQFTVNPHLVEYFLIVIVSFPDVINST